MSGKLLLFGFDSLLNVLALEAAMGPFGVEIVPVARTDYNKTLAVLAGVDIESGAMLTALHGMFPSTAASMAFLTFILLYMPCVAAFAAMKRELESRRWAVAAVAGQTATAWVCALIVYTLTRLAGV